MTNAALVARKLAFLREHLDRLKARRGRPLDEVRRDIDRQDALAMSLLVAVQEAIDVSFHLASDEKWGMPSSYREGFALMAAHKLIRDDVAGALAGMAQLRNRIAHGYATVEFERLWNELPSGIAALDAFVTAVAAFAAKATTSRGDTT
jgi:uncharacterized protein YutE (UPF0331/DUF86 family)